jgi:hypothetical protein
MKKAMIITMGTSVYESTSWDYNVEAEFLNTIYEKEWILDGECKLDHSKRMEKSGAISIRNNIIKVFSENHTNEDYFKKRVMPYLYPYKVQKEMRYSAELATILKYANVKDPVELPDILNKINKFYIVCEISVPKIHAAAIHLKYALMTLANIPTDNIEITDISGFSTPDKISLQKALPLFAKMLLEILPHYDEVVICISGGFKIYSLIAFMYWNEEKIKIIYLHENLKDIVLFNRDNIFIDNEEVSAFPQRYDDSLGLQK